MPSKKPTPAKKRRGRPAKLGAHTPFSIRLPAELHRQLRHYSIDHQLSLNDLVVQAVEEWWSKVPERPTYVRLVEKPVRKQ